MSGGTHTHTCMSDAGFDLSGRDAPCWRGPAVLGGNQCRASLLHKQHKQHKTANGRPQVPSTPTTKRATASLDLLDLIKQKPVSLDTTHSLPLPATLAAAALSYSRGELVVRCIL